MRKFYGRLRYVVLLTVCSTLIYLLLCWLTRQRIEARSLVEKKFITGEMIDDVVRRLAPRAAEIRERRASCIIPTYPLYDDVFKPIVPRELQVCTRELVVWAVRGDVYFYSVNETKNSLLEGCQVRHEIAIDDFNATWSERADVRNGSKLTGVYCGVEITCSVRGEERQIMGQNSVVTYDEKLSKRIKTIKIANYSPESDILSAHNISMMWLMFDNLGRRDWYRHLPKSMETLNAMNAIEFKGMNIVGDGTTANVLSMLAGRYECELPESRRRMNGARPIQTENSWLWDYFSSLGYTTGYSEDGWWSAAFNYRLLGFQNKPTDFYARHYWMLNRIVCDGAKLDLNFDLFQQMRALYGRVFTFMSLAGLSHSDTPKISQYDDVLSRILKASKEMRNNTIMVFFSDHGNRMSSQRASLNGKFEERQSMYTVLVPNWLEMLYPAKFTALRGNAADRLVSGFDIYHTWADTMGFKDHAREFSKWGVSLLEPRQERGCIEAGILEPHWCVCGGGEVWDLANQTNAAIAKNAAASFVEYINNNLLNPIKELCQEVSISHIVRLRELQFSEDMLQFAKTNDGDGRRPSYFKTDIPKLLEMSLVLSPGDASFEFTFHWKPTQSTVRPVKIIEGAISRTNRYGNAPDCITDMKFYTLKQYCYCK